MNEDFKIINDLREKEKEHLNGIKKYTFRSVK